jgi:hypothetical protein
VTERDVRDVLARLADAGDVEVVDELVAKVTHSLTWNYLPTCATGSEDDTEHTPE